MKTTNVNAALSIWHSKAFQYIILTVCTVIFLWYLEKIVGNWRKCEPCELPARKSNTVSNLVTAAIRNFPPS